MFEEHFRHKAKLCDLSLDANLIGFVQRTESNFSRLDTSS